jgi:hypothetical protein
MSDTFVFQSASDVVPETARKLIIKCNPYGAYQRPSLVYTDIRIPSWITSVEFNSFDSSELVVKCVDFSDCLNLEHLDMGHCYTPVDISMCKSLKMLDMMWHRVDLDALLEAHPALERVGFKWHDGGCTLSKESGFELACWTINERSHAHMFMGVCFPICGNKRGRFGISTAITCCEYFSGHVEFIKRPSKNAKLINHDISEDNGCDRHDHMVKLILTYDDGGIVHLSVINSHNGYYPHEYAYDVVGNGDFEYGDL